MDTEGSRGSFLSAMTTAPDLRTAVSLGKAHKPVHSGNLLMFLINPRLQGTGWSFSNESCSLLCSSFLSFLISILPLFSRGTLLAVQHKKLFPPRIQKFLQNSSGSTITAPTASSWRSVLIGQLVQLVFNQLYNRIYFRFLKKKNKLILSSCFPEQLHRFLRNLQKISEDQMFLLP